MFIEFCKFEMGCRGNSLKLHSCNDSTGDCKGIIRQLFAPLYYIPPRLDSNYLIEACRTASFWGEKAAHGAAAFRKPLRAA